MSELRERLEYLGLSQYFDAFVAEGFDSWETVLDITEPDLASLEVKLGHRRKLQRAIRESRSTSIDSSLPPTFSRGLSGDGSYRSDESGPETRQKRTDPFGAVASGSSTKRRYRRHPKPDEHAPERPASAYVIFSNQTREELKGQELSFADIAKVVGERWQVLPSDVREVFESQAAVAKEKYYLELAEYKKTSQYAQYQTYLQEFRAKHASNTSDKRSKLETETSISTQGSMNEFSGRPSSRLTFVGGSSELPGLQGRQQDSAPEAGPYHYPTALSGQSIPSASTSTRQLPMVNSPQVREPDHYSPMSVSPSSSNHYKDHGDMSPTFSTGVDSRDRRHESIHSQIFSTRGVSGTPNPPGSGTMSPFLNAHERPPRSELPRSPPQLVREGTTLSSDGSSYGGLMQHGHLLPLLDAPKAQRFLPPLQSLPPPPPDQRPPPQQSDIRHGSPLDALLRAGQLARDADAVVTGQEKKDHVKR